MYFADIASSPFYCGWNWRTGWARSSIAGTEIEGKLEIKALCPLSRKLRKTRQQRARLQAAENLSERYGFTAENSRFVSGDDLSPAVKD
jgi:hypothetical protein